MSCLACIFVEVTDVYLGVSSRRLNARVDSGGVCHHDFTFVPMHAMAVHTARALVNWKTTRAIL